MLGTPSLTVKDIVIGARVQNFRCRRPEESGSSGKLRVEATLAYSLPQHRVRSAIIG